MKTVPENFENVGEIMSNFDHVIEKNAENNLKNNSVYGEYAGWSFFAEVWYEDGLFYAMIQKYTVHMETLSNETLEGIMEDASEIYGSG